MLKAHGYRAGEALHAGAEPARAVPGALAARPVQRRRAPGRPAVRRLLDAVPSYFSQGVVTADRKTANLAFGIRLMPLDRQKEVVDDIKARLNPPPGVQAVGGGAARAGGRGQRRPVVALAARRSRCCAALAGVFLVLLVARSSAREAAVPLIPIALATGWSGLVRVRAGPPAGPARGRPQPDVRHAQRARDRDLDRVQRAALGALPPGARRRRRPGPGDRAHVRVHRRGGARVGRHGDRRLRARWSSRTSACCATSGS